MTSNNNNILPIYCNKQKFIHVYDIYSEYDVPLFEYKHNLSSHFNEAYNKCLIAGNRIFLLNKLTKTELTLKAPYCENIEVKFHFQKSLRVKNCTEFFQILLQRITDYLNDQGEMDVSNMSVKSHDSLVSLTQGIWIVKALSIDEFEEGVSLSLNVNYKIACQLPVYEFIRRESIKYQTQMDWTSRVKNLFIGKTVTTHYNNKIYKIDDLDFSTTPMTKFFCDEHGMISFADYYKKKYNISTRYPNQPMIICKVIIEGPGTSGKMTLMNCLIPEFCYPVYSEWDPMDDNNKFREFVECIKSTPKAKEILSEWNLFFDPITIFQSKRLSLFDSPSDHSSCANISAAWKKFTSFSK